jgi:hypothetical protein
MVAIVDFPNLNAALNLLGEDIGADVNAQAVIPEKWEDRAAKAEAELVLLSATELEDLARGEDTERDALLPRCPNADAFLADAFDGDLSDLIFEAPGFAR